MKIFWCVAIAALTVAGSVSAYADDCSGHDHNTGTVVGAVGGAAIGGAASHNLGGAVVGGVLGGLAGNAIDRSQDCNRQIDNRPVDDRRYDNRPVDNRQYDNRQGYAGVYQERGRNDEGDYWGVESYEDFGADFRHISENIQRGRENGFYSYDQARSYSQRLQQIRYQADEQQRMGRFNPEEIEARLTRLRDTMRMASSYSRSRDRDYQH